MGLDEHTIGSRAGEPARKAWILRPSDAAGQRVCLFLDAELYFRIGAPEALAGLVSSGGIPPTTAVFLSHLNHEARVADFTCNPRFSRYLAKEVIPWVLERHAAVATGHSICGISLSGLAAAYLAFDFPVIFPRALCQSGSFWWNGEWLTCQASFRGPSSGRFWISVGDGETETDPDPAGSDLPQEVSQLEASEKFASALRSLGSTVRYNVFSGGHAPGPWKAELPSALRWLLGPC